MRCYPSFGLPGIDMLCDFHEYNTAKQTQSRCQHPEQPQIAAAVAEQFPHACRLFRSNAPQLRIAVAGGVRNGCSAE